MLDEMNVRRDKSLLNMTEFIALFNHCPGLQSGVVEALINQGFSPISFSVCCIVPDTGGSQAFENPMYSLYIKIKVSPSGLFSSFRDGTLLITYVSYLFYPCYQKTAPLRRTLLLLPSTGISLQKLILHVSRVHILFFATFAWKTGIASRALTI